MSKQQEQLFYQQQGKNPYLEHSGPSAPGEEIPLQSANTAQRGLWDAPSFTQDYNTQYSPRDGQPQEPKDTRIDFEQNNQGKSDPVFSTYNSYVADASVEMRKGFIRKVYAILVSQLALVSVQCAVCMSVEPVRLFLVENTLIVWLSFIPSFLLLFAVLILRRKFPINMILLYTWTFFNGISLAFITSLYTVTSVLVAAGVTGAVFLALTIFTFVSKKDFSFLGAYLFVGLAALIMASMAQILIFVITGKWSQWADFAISIVGAVLFSLFIVYDTSRLIHKYRVDEYAHASISLYLDIINLFLYILSLLGSRRN